jgi:hypothetical protein
LILVAVAPIKAPVMHPSVVLPQTVAKNSMEEQGLSIHSNRPENNPVNPPKKQLKITVAFIFSADCKTSPQMSALVAVIVVRLIVCFAVE